MRNLDLDEIFDKIADYTSDIRYSDKNHLEIKITQFFNFLLEQPISRRTLERIREDFQEIGIERSKAKNAPSRYKANKEFLKLLTTKEKQGAFAFFEIEEKCNQERKHSNFFIESAFEWYEPGGETFQWHEDFNSYFFEPFTELLVWYFRESKIQQENDYFSREEINKVGETYETKLKEQIQKLEFGQEIIFNETEEIKELITALNKKNWTELIKGKFRDLILTEVISLETAELLIQTITGEQISLK